MNKFTKSFLRNSLGFDKEEIDLVMTAQRKFPSILSVEDENGFCVDGESLCRELGVKDNFNDWLLSNRKSKQGKLIKYRCKENKDYIVNREIAKT